MFSFGTVFAILVATIFSVDCSGVAVPLIAPAPGFETPLFARAAPLHVPAHVGYAHAIPQNIPPYASQVSVVNQGFAAPFVAPAAASYIAGTIPVGPGPYAFAAGPAPLVGPAVGSSPYFAPGPLAAPYISAPRSIAGPAPYLAGPAPYLAGPAAVVGPAPLVAGPGPLLRPEPIVGPTPYLAGPAPFAAPFARGVGPVPV